MKPERCRNRRIEDLRGEHGFYRKIHVKMYADTKYNALSTSPSATHLWYYLLAGPHTTNLPGIFIAGEMMLAEALRWPIEDFRRCLKEITNSGMAFFDAEHRLFMIPNAIKYNPPNSLNTACSWKKSLIPIPECDLKREYVVRLTAFLGDLGKTYADAFRDGRLGPSKTADFGESRPQKSPAVGGNFGEENGRQTVSPTVGQRKPNGSQVVSQAVGQRKPSGSQELAEPSQQTESSKQQDVHVQEIRGGGEILLLNSTPEKEKFSGTPSKKAGSGSCSVEGGNDFPTPYLDNCSSEEEKKSIVELEARGLIDRQELEAAIKWAAAAGKKKPVRYVADCVTKREPDTWPWRRSAETVGRMPPGISGIGFDWEIFKFIGINGKLALLKEKFPSIDVSAELLSIEAWLAAKPQEITDCGALIYSWLAKATKTQRADHEPKVVRPGYGEDDYSKVVVHRVSNVNPKDEKIVKEIIE